MIFSQASQQASGGPAGPPVMIKTQVILFSVTFLAPPMHYLDWFSVNSLREDNQIVGQETRRTSRLEELLCKTLFGPMLTHSAALKNPIDFLLSMMRGCLRRIPNADEEEKPRSIWRKQQRDRLDRRINFNFSLSIMISGSSVICLLHEFIWCRRGSKFSKFTTFCVCVSKPWKGGTCVAPEKDLPETVNSEKFTHPSPRKKAISGMFYYCIWSKP